MPALVPALLPEASVPESAWRASGRPMGSSGLAGKEAGARGSAEVATSEQSGCWPMPALMSAQGHSVRCWA